MRKITLTRLEISNFKGIKHKVVEFGKRTTIKGRNAVGKTTLYNAVLWCLFDKDMQGNSAADIRPHDENGIDINNIDIVVASTFDVDGREITLKKTQRQKWVKKRGSEEKKFEGNENLFEISDIPKALKDYKAYIEENFCPEDVFYACSNASSFFKLDTKKRRAKLMSLAKEFSDSDVIATDKAFESLADMLRDGTVEELMTRSKATIKRLNEQLKLIPARIDEQEKSKVDIDVAELELAKNGIKEKIADVESKISDISKQYEEYQKASDGILELQFEINDLKRKANEDLQSQKAEIEVDMFSLDCEIRDLQRNIKQIENYIDSDNHLIEIYNRKIKDCSAEWNIANKRVFNETRLVCPYCKQEYPAEEKDRLRAEFESQKADELREITDRGNALKSKIEKSKTEIETLRVELEKTQKELEKNSNELEKLKSDLSSLPTEIDISDTEEYKALVKQIAEKEEFLANGNSADEIRNDLSMKKAILQTQLDEINEKIGMSMANVNCDERISELQEEQRATGQKVADEERILDLLERFNRAKMNMLTEAVNKHFGMVKWVLFIENINGGYTDVCYAAVGGSNYEKTLNHGDRILADIDILNTFQKMNDVQLPIWVDDSESVDEWRLPTLDTQMIVLRRTDDKEMVIEMVE